ncbi:hypothetical protein [Abyssisolibacter fermentans]|uniref:hypothetical protein n=1 Tax=Abyssisolibacter fermentans TaxID=1766203 RepID=UPI00083300C4|nr:hypothetical protein [Abyssisolibacter fermentans]
MRFKDIVGGVFSKIAVDSELLNLLDIPSDNLETIKKQIVEEKYPAEIGADNLPRLYIYENQPTNSLNSSTECCNIQIDIYVPKSLYKEDKRTLLIASRLYDLLSGSDIEGITLRYSTRLPNLPIDNNDWIKYGIVFNYTNIII